MHIIKVNLYIESKKVDYVYNIKKRELGDDEIIMIDNNEIKL